MWILSLRVSLELVVIFNFCSWTSWLSDNLAILEHLQGCLGLEFGSKSWSKSDSKNSFDFLVWVCLTLFRNAGGGVFSLLQGIKLFSLLC